MATKTPASKVANPPDAGWTEVKGRIPAGASQLAITPFCAAADMKPVIVQLNELPGDPDLLGPEPDSGLCASVARLGIVVPIIIVATPSSKFPYGVVAGRRRVKAARRAGFTEITALVLPSGSATSTATVMAAENAHRSQNHLAMVMAVASEFAAGSGDVRLIAVNLDIPMRECVAICNLLKHPHGGLWRGLREGLISYTAALRLMDVSTPEEARVEVATHLDKGMRATIEYTANVIRKWQPIPVTLPGLPAPAGAASAGTALVAAAPQTGTAVPVSDTDLRHELDTAHAWADGYGVPRVDAAGVTLPVLERLEGVAGMLVCWNGGSGAKRVVPRK